MRMAKQIFSDWFIPQQLNASKWSPAWGKLYPDEGTQMQFTDKNIYPGNGLHLHATVATGADAEKAPFLSAMVSTRKPDKGEILFQAKGQFIVSVTATLPVGVSSWPGIWLTGTKGDWPACGKISVLEARGWQHRDYQMNVHNPRAGEPTKSQQHQKMLSQTQSTLKTNYSTTHRHTYSVVKLNDRVDFYLDTELVHTVMYSEMDDPTPFTDPENGWVINLSHIIGGSFLEYNGNREYVDATKYARKPYYPAQMFIESVDVVSLDEQGDALNTSLYRTLLGILNNYKDVKPTPPVVVTPTPEPPVVVTPTPTPAPVPKPKGEMVKGDWVREEDALVFIML